MAWYSKRVSRHSNARIDTWTKNRRGRICSKERASWRRSYHLTWRSYLFPYHHFAWIFGSQVCNSAVESRKEGFGDELVVRGVFTQFFCSVDIAGFNGQVSWRGECAEEVPSSDRLLHLNGNLWSLRLAHVEQEGSFSIPPANIEIEHMLLSVEDNCLGYVILLCLTLLIASSDNLCEFPVDGFDFFFAVFCRRD